MPLPPVGNARLAIGLVFPRIPTLPRQGQRASERRARTPPILAGMVAIAPRRCGRPSAARLHLFICAGWSGVFLIPPIGTDYASEKCRVGKQPTLL